MTLRSHLVVVLAFMLSLLTVVAGVHAQATYPARIGDREFIADKAGMITPEDQTKIRATASKLLDEKGIPLVVVTIPSMEDYGASGWPIERYAMNLFDEWGIGHTARNSGILLLVSKGDRKARIELGAGWSHERDAVTSAVMSGVIVPQFKAGRYSQGIAQGVDALAGRMGGAAASAPTSSDAPSTPSSPAVSQRSASSHGPPGMGGLLGPLACVVVAIVIIVALVVLTRMRRSASGPPPIPGTSGVAGYGPYGWGGGGMGGGGGGWGGFFPGLLLGQWFGGRNWGSSSGGSSTSSGSLGSSGSSDSSWGGGGGFFGGGGSSDGGGFSGGGGSFGGGFSGGGGSTGSW